MGRHLCSPDQSPIVEEKPCSTRAWCSVLPFICAGLRQALALAKAVCTGAGPVVPHVAVLSAGFNGGCQRG